MVDRSYGNFIWVVFSLLLNKLTLRSNCMTPEGTTKIASDHKTKLAWMTLLVPSLYILEWGLVGITAAFVGFLKYHDISYWSIWLLLWGLNLLYSSAVVLFSDHSQIDITLMEALRRWTNKIAKRWHWSARFLEFIVIVRLLFWDGPCRLLIYIREKFPSPMLRRCVFVGASGLQMFIWAQIYILGCESVSDLLKAIQ